MKSGHGGRRENSGRPNNWHSNCPASETKLIRIPIRIADQLLEIAHCLDAGMEVKVVPKQLEINFQNLEH